MAAVAAEVVVAVQQWDGSGRGSGSLSVAWWLLGGGSATVTVDVSAMGIGVHEGWEDWDEALGVSLGVLFVYIK